MIDINLIRQNPDIVRQGIKKKNCDPELVDKFLTIDNQWRELVKKIDDLRARQNILSKEQKIEEAKQNKQILAELKKQLPGIEAGRLEIWLRISNLPLPNVPAGKDSTQNVVLREVGKKPKFPRNFIPKDYLTLGEDLGLIDVIRPAKISGSRFGYLLKEAALLEFALVQFAFKELIKYGFILVIPPILIKPEIMKAMGYIDSEQDKEERYFLEKDNLYLVGTAEQSIAPMHKDEIFEEKDLPRRYVGFSTCLRREAGSYGKDTKGILRVHQFDKIEMISFCKPEDSEKEHQFLLSMQENLMQSLKIPYRVVQLCAGDLSHPSAATYDIEAWLPGQNEGRGEYRETHSVSNCADFQARRLNTRYKPKTINQQPTTQFVHILNGTAFAIGRTIIAIIENGQTAKGTIKIPAALRKYIPH